MHFPFFSPCLSSRLKKLNSEGDSSIDCLVGDLPWVLEPARGVTSFEGGDSHDETVNEDRGNRDEAAVRIVGPGLKGHIALVRRLYVPSIEDYLAEAEDSDNSLGSQRTFHQ